MFLYYKHILLILRVQRVYFPFQLFSSFKVSVLLENSVF